MYTKAFFCSSKWQFNLRGWKDVWRVINRLKQKSFYSIAMIVFGAKRSFLGIALNLFSSDEKLLTTVNCILSEYVYKDSTIEAIILSY